ncbi:MAG: formate dehydrogenase accessory sulfurtransferase FdhD [Gemmataceae bacterium]
MQPIATIAEPERADSVAVEEPLEIVLEFGAVGSRVRRTASVTMRTPGNDEELAVGFLFAEGVIRSRDEVQYVGQCGHANAVRVELRPEMAFTFENRERHFTTTSSCGVCGKTSLDGRAANFAATRHRPLLPLSQGRSPIACDPARSTTDVRADGDLRQVLFILWETF